MSHQSLTYECEYAKEYPFRLLRRADDDAEDPQAILMAEDAIVDQDNGFTLTGRLPRRSRASAYQGAFREQKLGICEVGAVGASDPAARRFCDLPGYCLRAPFRRRENEIVNETIHWSIAHVWFRAEQTLRRGISLQICSAEHQIFGEVFIAGGGGPPTAANEAANCPTSANLAVAPPTYSHSATYRSTFTNPTDGDGNPCPQDMLDSCAQYKNAYTHTGFQNFRGYTCMEETIIFTADTMTINREIFYGFGAVPEPNEGTCTIADFGTSDCTVGTSGVTSPVCPDFLGQIIAVTGINVGTPSGSDAPSNWWELIDEDDELFGIPVMFPEGTREQIPE